MALPPPVPSAGASSPPATKLPIVDLKTGLATLSFVSFLTQLWAAVLGDGGLGPTIDALVAEVAALTAQVAIIFGMHGDGTLAPDGTLTVTKTNGTPFGPFATGTDAADLTGTLDPARIANNSVPLSKLVDTTGPALLGAGAAGPVTQVTIGRGLALSVGDILSAGDPITTVGALGAATAGLRAFVTDSNVAAATNFGNVVAAGGANFVPVYADGAAWRIG